MRNDLKAALDKIDQQYLNELVGGQEPGEEDTQNDLKVHEENTTIEELEVIPPPPSSLPHPTFHSLELMVELIRLFSSHSTLASLVITKALLFHDCCLFTPFFLIFYTHSPPSCLQKYSFWYVRCVHPFIYWWSCKTSNVLYACASVYINDTLLWNSSFCFLFSSSNLDILCHLNFWF